MHSLFLVDGDGGGRAGGRGRRWWDERATRRLGVLLLPRAGCGCGPLY